MENQFAKRANFVYLIFSLQNLESTEDLEKSQKAKKPTKNIGLMALIFIILHLAFYIIWYYVMEGQQRYNLFSDWRTLTEPFRYAFKSQEGYRIKTNLGTYALINPMPVLSLIAGIYFLHKTISNKVNHSYLHSFGLTYFWLDMLST